MGDTHPGEHEAARLSAKPTGGSVEALVIGAPEQVAVMTEALLEGFCWRTYHQARAARSDDDGGLSGVRRVTLKPRRESPLSIADSRQPG